MGDDTRAEQTEYIREYIMRQYNKYCDSSQKDFSNLPTTEVKQLARVLKIQGIDKLNRQEICQLIKDKTPWFETFKLTEFNDLNNDVIRTTLFLLNEEDMIRSRLINKNFNRIVSSPDFLADYYYKILFPDLDNESKQEFKIIDNMFVNNLRFLASLRIAERINPKSMDSLLEELINKSREYKRVLSSIVMKYIIMSPDIDISLKFMVMQLYIDNAVNDEGAYWVNLKDYKIELQDLKETLELYVKIIGLNEITEAGDNLLFRAAFIANYRNRDYLSNRIKGKITYIQNRYQEYLDEQQNLKDQ